MASENSAAFVLPKVPVPHKNFVSFVSQNQAEAIQNLVAPYNQFEAKIREGFAQYRDHEALKDPKVNAVPIFDADNDILRIHARSTEDQSSNEKYIMPLKAKDRKLGGAAATVESMQDFKKNFNLFSESSLADLDWSNVVAAGSSVVTALLPVPDKYNTSKKALREYYHQQLAPSSDVDLFIWGLDEAAALEKMVQIEASIRNAILKEVTTVRTKNAITIASHYPIRHVQIVLRLYKSVSEILSGFDVDCSCFAYDGSQIYGTPRSIAAFMTQTNTIDMSRRSPSYESRLSKYARRGFEVYWPELDRSRTDPTIFERSFSRTMGLARLLVLEQLPKPNDREQYLNQRREERGRPSADNRYWNRQNALPGNVKDEDPDDIAEWVYDDEVSNYHSFTVPYGPKYHAKRIEKLLYTKDLLLNAEWNQTKNRTVNLHRHPCFIGPVEYVIHDCCRFCPEPKTDEERETAEEESKIYVFGDLFFMKDDPGRQTIGSFHPLTDDDWTDMAYIGNTQELCQKICDGDLDFVENWCEKSPESIDRRDHTGRTPLHIAAQCSTSEILECLVDHGARIVARLVDGMTALHIAAARGSVEMVNTLLEQSEENEAEEDEKAERKNMVRHTTPSDTKQSGEGDTPGDKDSDYDMDDAGSDEDTAMTEGSFVKVGDKELADEDALNDADDTEPDVYDVNVIAWDNPVSALHLAILGGHTEVIKVLVSTFGADVLLPIKILDSYSRNPKAAIMTLIIAAQLSGSKCLDVTKELFSLGASSAQRDMQNVTAFQYLVAERKVQLLKACFDEDGAASRTALDHLTLQDPQWRPRSETPLTTAIRSGDSDLVGALLDFGAKPVIDLDDFAAAYALARESSTSYWYKNDKADVSEIWKKHTQQPIFLAVENDMPDAIVKMVGAGADINALDTKAHEAIAQSKDDNQHLPHGKSLLDAVKAKISNLEDALGRQLELPRPINVEDDQAYLEVTDPESYEHWYLSRTIEAARNMVKEWEENRTRRLDQEKDRHGKQQSIEALRALQKRFVCLKDQLSQLGAKSLEELHPDIVSLKHDKGEKVKKQDKPFEPKVSFQLSSTDKIRERYLQLFEAVWEGSIAQIKRLTLANWGPEEKNNPLMVTVQDSKGFTLFAIAIYRRHFEVAKMILEIANVQFKDSDEGSTRRRYTMADNFSDADSGDEDDDLGISSQVVDETYTLDNIAALKQSVGSKVSASELLAKNAEIWCLLDLPEEEAREKLGNSSYTSDISYHVREGVHSSDAFRKILSSKGHTSDTLGRYFIVSRNLDLLRFWLRCCQEASKMKLNSSGWFFCGFNTSDFQYALEHGFIEELGEMIKIAGAQLPLDALIKQSGLQEEEKPKYYQGLSIGGKKMTAWARERGGRGYQQAMGESTPPLLQAAFQGGLASVEWFLSDTPFRLYKEYGANNANSARLKMLTKAHDGLDQAVSSWLKQRSIAAIPSNHVDSTDIAKGDLSLHAAVLSPAPDDESLSVLNCLLSILPASINLPSASSSLTPLALSFLTGRTSAAKTLISADADQTTRDSTSKNLIHLSLISISKTSTTNVSDFRALLALIDKRLFPSLFTERCRDSPGGLTPLAYWLASIATNPWASADAKLVPEVLSVMLEFGGEEALEMMDWSGQFPLHQAVKHSYFELVKLMLAHDPQLLARENAMGQTPLELAESLYIRDCTSGNPDIRRSDYRTLVNRQCEDFVGDESGIGEKNDVRRTWKICRDCARENPRARKLISVSEAREVARRLAERNKAESEEERIRGEEGKEEVKRDEVDGWLGESALTMG